MTDTATPNPDRYLWGASARVRAYRDYFGLGTYDMADTLGMSRRSYLRIESGEAAVPPGFWNTLDALVTRFENEVMDLLSLRRDTDTGRALVAVSDDADQWRRTVIAHAMIRDPRLRPASRDDLTAEKENQHERAHL